MKVSLSWLKELVDFKLTPQELADQLSLKSIGVKQVTSDYIELDLTYNRGDLLSVRGVAKEVAAIANSQIKFEDKENGQFIFGDKVIPSVDVKVENSILCPLYTLTKIEIPQVKPSNSDVIKKLSDSAVRSINNVADITNLIMIKYGQPMHAFDASKVKGRVIVRSARTGEKITTLDGKLRTLSDQDLLIADETKPIGIAGVMGGKDSEISESTTTILLEAAIFNPISNRSTSKRHGIYSEASKRFQHGLTKTSLFQALDETIRLYQEFGGRMAGFTIIGDIKDKSQIVQLTQQKINSLLGIDIPADHVETSLKSLGFHPKGAGSNAWEVTIPYWRLDINIEEDLTEEIARIYGYEKIEGIQLTEKKTSSLDQTLPVAIYDLKIKLKNLGLTEVQTYSFYSTSVLEALELTKDSKKYLIKIANPISSETEFMRMELWPNLLEVVGKNIKKGIKDIGIFEIGKVYFRNEEGKPEEKYRLTIVLMNGSDNPIEELYQIIQNLGSNLGGCRLNPKLMHPNRQTNGMAEVHLRVLNKFGIEKRVAVTELLI